MERFNYLRGTSKECIDAFDKLQEKIDSFIPKSNTCLFVPCSWGKPYSQSYIHFYINIALYTAGLFESVDRWHISSAGVIPADIEMYGIENDVSFCAYDWNPVNSSREEEAYLSQRLEERLRYWWKKRQCQYTTIKSYLKPTAHSLRALKNIALVENLVVDSNPYSDLPLVYLNDADHILIYEKNLVNMIEQLRKMII